MTRQPDTPRFLAHLPKHRGLPVPFTVTWVNGVPDFRVIDHDQVRRCVAGRLCAICGRRLGEHLWFIGGPVSLEQSHLFADPPMHERCAGFAMTACPFLSGKTTEHNSARPLPEAVGENPLVTPGRGDKIGMRRALRFEAVEAGGYPLIRVTKWFGRARWVAGKDVDFAAPG
jgi:hypothetical protein